MKLERRMAFRIAALAGLAFFLGSAGALVLGRAMAREVATRRVTPLVRDLFTDADLAACRAGSPAPLERAGLIRYDFYDAAGAPLHPAPQLDATLASALESDPLPSRFDLGDLRGKAVFRIRAGQCALVMASWAPAPRRPGALLLPVGATLLAGAALLSMLAFLFVARPLLVRLAELSARARRLGTADYEPGPVWPDEAGEIARALDETHLRLTSAQRRLAERNVALEGFLAETMHDLRTPLSSLQLALDEIAEEAPPAAADALRRALDDTMYIGSLTQNLRLSTRLESGWEPLSAGATVDLVAVAERVSRRFQPFAVRRGITVCASLPAQPVIVPGEETAAEQAIANLVENAVSHGAAGMTVRVLVTQEGEKVRVCVADDGARLTPEEVARLAEPSPADERARSRRARGSGLGLTITRAVCERSGWELSFEAGSPRGLVAIVEARVGAPGLQLRRQV